MDGGIGVCVKDRNWKVLKQDEACREICGDRVGKVCQDGCTHSCGGKPGFPVIDEGLHSLPSTSVGGRRHDAAVFVTSDEIVTFVYPVEERKARQLKELEALGLTRRELEICQLALDGMTNRRICRQLFISLPTLKTHMNNIYKKIPPSSPLARTLKER